ncbi:TonB-dependent receptor domain-containing protein [Phenylobacterium sp.]|jgi:iron complex outermembrane receptor protein|uniref:TonB-dependent receptor domain-containing protein n=1 Tax=Phenylobacterium sp. TaxID=1871053 RepID=UPI003783DD98
MTRTGLLLCTAAALFGGAAAAQPLEDQARATAGGEAEVETITVTASRIQVQGYEAPTPVTVVDSAALQRDARPDVGDVLRELPAFGPSSGPSNSVRSTYVTDGSAGLNLVSLRNLGSRRTLVLFNGQRVVESNLSLGGVDLSTIPSTLIERMDVVTGGASAAWGSNAVAGVVNIVLDTDFEGFKANLQASNNWDREREQYQAEISVGKSFLDGRAHVILSGSIEESPDTYFNNLIDNFSHTRLLENPAFAAGNGQPRYITRDGAGPLLATPGGIITAGPLRGTYFVGPSATPLQFNYGNTSRGSWTWGGTPNYGLSHSDFGVIANPTDSQNLFGYASYDITDNLKASVQLNYGRFHTVGNSWTASHNGSLTIRIDNPFLPASVVQRMQQAGVTTFQLGTSLTGDVSGNGGSIEAERDMLGMPIVDLERELSRGVFALDGKMQLFGSDWTWNAYYQKGRAKSYSDVLNNPQTANIRNAVDAVLVTAENVGTSGLPIGSIACRSTLTNPTNGCAPLDVFGTGKDVSAAAHYINIAARTGQAWMRDRLEMETVAASTSGQLPFGLPAGNISAAFGAEYRKESGRIIAAESGKQNLFYVTGNFKDFDGSYNTKEAFAEFNIPLLQDQVVESFDLDLAARYTDYSVSGSVWTYKVGLLSQVNDFLRLRGTYSRDIRAPSLFEMFNKGQLIGTSAVDPRTGQQVSTFAVTQGNINLTPEIAKTTTVGAILTPTFVPGLRVSVDWWRVKIDDVITTASQTTIINQCIAGEQAFCDNLVFDGPNGALSRILLQPVNAALQVNEGIDFAADYTQPLFSGDLSLRFVGSYMYEDTQDFLGVKFNAAGGIGWDQRRGGFPKFRGTTSATYSEDRWSLTTQARIVGKAVLNKEWGPQDVDDNSVPRVIYLDLRGSFNVTDNIQLYGAVDNVLNKNPPIVTSTTGNAWYAPFNDSLHDVFGRVVRVGARLQY